MGTTILSERSLTNIQNKAARLFLNRLGYSRSTPNAVVFGPSKLGGADFRPLYDEQGSKQMELVLKHLRSRTAATDHLRIALSWAQQMSGVSTPILQDPAMHLPHLTTKFFPSLRQYLHDTGSHFELQETFVVPLQREGDVHLMDLVVQSGRFKDNQICMINSCRMFLQVHTVSDLSNARGTHMDPSFFQGQPSLLSSQSRRLETIQERPQSSTVWQAWRDACMLWCSTVSYKLHTPLGPWLTTSPDLRRTWPYHWDPNTKFLYVRQPDRYL